MELPVRIEESVNRVSMHSSTKKERVKVPKDRNPRWKIRKSREERGMGGSRSDSSLDPEFPPVATFKKGVGRSWIPADVSTEIWEQLDNLASDSEPSPRKVRFNDVPIFIESERKPDDYDII